MKRNESIIVVFFMAWLLCDAVLGQPAFDSLGVKLPRHYFNTVVIVDGYSKPDKKIDTNNLISKRLKSYGVKQFYLSFYTPILTHVEEDAVTHVLSNSHLLLTGNLISLKPVFGGLPVHRLTKFGLGVRYIYNTGKKGVWFFDVSPFLTRDATYASKPYLRLASTFIYSHNVNEKFNWRLGVTKSFMWGNRFYLPFIGLRIGKLDKVNLSIQFPRNIQLNFPLSPMWLLSVYTRPQGGMYNYANSDSLYFRRNARTFHFTRAELNTGFRIDGRITSNFNFYFATGISSKNNITFYSETANPAKRKIPYYSYFYAKNIAPSLFFNLGVVFRFGKTRTYLNNRNIYDAIDLNNTLDGNRSNQIPITPKKQSALNLKGIEDLVDYNDL